MRALHVLVAGALAGCSQTPRLTASDREPAALTYAQMEAVYAGLRRTLKDPESARFGGVAAAQSTKDRNSYYVCGFVNAKNSFGGYTGLLPYTGVLGLRRGDLAPWFEPILIASRETEVDAVNTLCVRDYGIDLSLVPRHDLLTAAPEPTAPASKGKR